MSNSPWTSWTRKLQSFASRPILHLAIILSLFPLFASVRAAAQATNFAIGTTVQQSNVKRLGINVGGQNYYDSGQMLRNLIFQNPGFEGETWQSALNCVSVTATSCTDANTWNVWPANFLAGATFQVISGAASGETGTITSDTGSAYAAGNTTNPNYGLTFNFSALSTPLTADCWVIVRMPSIPGNAQAGWWSSTSGGGTLSTDTTDIAPDSPGKQALMMSASSSGQSATVNQAFDTWGGRSFIQLNGTYTLDFKAKGLGGNNVLNVSIQRLATKVGNENFLNQNVTLTNQWQDYSYSFTANEDGTYIGPVEVVFTVSGASGYLDDVSLTEGAAANNPTAYRNAVVNTLQALHPGVLRYMTGTDFGASTADIVAVPFARQRAGINSQATEQDEVPAGLEEFLVLCQTVGAEPWYTMAGEATPQDMQNLIEFLGGSSSTPYGAIRAALGQSAPWTSVFPKIHIELGNEMWNGAMTGEDIDDPVVYGKYAATIFAAARSSASYNSSVFDLIMGSQEANPWWTQQEMLNSSGYDSVDAAPYLYNTLSDISSNEAIFGPMFAQPEQIDEPSSPSGNFMAQQAAQAATGPVNLEVYEVNLSTDAGSAPQSAVTQVAAGVGAGITVADHMLLMMRDLGITTQNMFSLPEFQNGFNCTASPCANGETMPLWGAVVDMGGETNLLRPQYLAEQLANNAILPTMLATTVTGANPTWNQPLSANDTVTPIQLPTAHYLQSFAFTDGTHYSVVVMNLSRSGSLPVTFSGANAPTGNVLISQLTSVNPTDNNEGLTTNAPVVSTKQTNVSNFNPATAYSLPPFSMTVFQWPGSTLPASSTTLTASPTSGNTGQAITLTATVASQGSNTPTGTVTFLNGGTMLGTGQLNASGVATLSVTSLPVGADPITASYGGDSNDAGSTSSAVTVNIASSAGAAPVTPTPAPVTPTPAPVTPTPAPVTPTPAPVTPTPAPVTPTPAPVTPTPAPVTPTPAPVTPTPAPVTPTPAPVTPTPAPVTPTPAPVTPTPAPVTPTPAPVTPTPAPVTPTPAPVTPTPAPVTPTPAPVTPTPAPVTPTPAPVTPTPAPVTPTPAPVTPTPAPVTPTPAPVTPTPTPVTPTPAPVVGSSGTPGYTMAVSKSDVTVSKGEIANVMVTLTPVNGFNLPVNLTCSGLPVGTTCNFSPPTVTPNGAPVSSTLSILVGSSPAAAAQNRLPGGSSGGMLAFGLAMPWGFISLLGLSKRKNRSRMAGWPIRLMVTAALIAGSLWTSGCGYSTNGSIFTMTLTAAGQNVPTQTSQVTVSITP